MAKGIEMKVITDGEGGVAGYVCGDGELPPDFDKDAFLRRLMAGREGNPMEMYQMITDGINNRGGAR
jgi:hypothetical protein